MIGAGTYADDRLGAGSATGPGEAIIRLCLVRSALELVGRGLTHEQHLAALGEHGAREPDRVHDATHHTHRAGGERLARHDRGIHLEPSLPRSAPT